MKTLPDIEQHARELAGGEFEVTRPPTVDRVWVEHERCVYSCNSERSYLFLGGNESDIQKFARFVSICSQLDAWIKGDAK